DILDAVDAIVGELRDVHHAIEAGQNFHKRPEVGDACHLAGVNLANLGILGHAADAGFGARGAHAVGRGDVHGAIVLDINLDAKFLDDAADRLTAGADDLTDLLGVDLDDRDARRELAHLV